jgi:hypothetical protein
MKIALCFIINYEHVLNKENIWKEWINQNSDIINVYFYYKDITKITSPWILKHVIDQKYIFDTSYYHIIPAYLSLMSYALKHDTDNQWFCMLTESCCPIISPKRFRYLFYNYHKYTIMNWRKAWWNVQLIKRANLLLLPENLHLANDPWFIMKREDVQLCFKYTHIKPQIFKTICDGGIANESLFAIILYSYNQLKNVKQTITHITDWSRMTSSTSPYLFKEASKTNIDFIHKSLKEHPNAIFIRKVSSDFPDNILNDFIYTQTINTDKLIILKDPFIFKKIWKYITIFFKIICVILLFSGGLYFHNKIDYKK